MDNNGVEQSQVGTLKKIKVASTSTSKLILPPSPPSLELPDDIMAKILHKLGPLQLLCSAQYVSTKCRKICREPTMWRVIDMWKLADYDVAYWLWKFLKDCKRGLCRLAVDLSQGQVTEINIEDFGSDDLLEYIAERCGDLRCLRLAFCNNVSGKMLSRVVKRFPLLEELHLECTFVDKDDIEAIGQSCPRLKTFALNGLLSPHVLKESSKDALAVATFLPELRHLRLFGSKMSNDGLEAILNGCPKLESLDLRHCWNLNLDGELVKRCVQQIEVLQLPDDPTDDYKWHSKVSHLTTASDFVAFNQYGQLHGGNEDDFVGSISRQGDMSTHRNGDTEPTYKLFEHNFFALTRFVEKKDQLQ